MKYTVLLLLLLPLSNLLAQDFKLAGIEYSNYPKVQLKDAIGDYQISFKEFGAYVNFPHRLKNNKTTLINGFQYGRVQATSYNTNLSAQNTQDFHKISYNLTLIHKWNDNWAISARISPSLASDFGDKLSGDDFLLQGSVLVNKKMNDNILAGMGLIYTTQLGKPMLLPILQFQYKKNRHSLNIFAPFLINYDYQVDSKEQLRIGLRTALNGANFNTSVNNFSNTAEIDRLNYSRANVGPFINYQLSKVLQIEAFGGLSTMLKYQFEDTHDNNYKYNSKSGSFFNIGLAITPPRKNKN